MAKQQATVGELQDELKRKDERIEELRQEIDEQRELIQRLREQEENNSQIIESWCEAFGMEMVDDGWTWKPFWDEHNKIVDDYNDLVRNWNKCLPLINRQPRNVGRPIAASDAQIREVRTRRIGMGESLRHIADEMNLGLQTVRTIIDQKAGSDRTTRHHRQWLERIDIDRQQVRKWKRQRQTGNRLPRRVNSVLKEGRALVKEAKGLGRR